MIHILWLLAALLVLHSLISAPLAARFNGRSPQIAYAANLDSPDACQELLINGDLETSGGWTFVATPKPGTVVDTPVHVGSFAMRLGIASGTNTTAYSTAYQSILLPAAAEQIVLTYWEHPGTTGDGGDARESILFRPDFSVLRTLTRQTGAGNDQWTQRSFDLSDLRGQTVVLYFNVFNNGSGATLVNYLDDISLQSCDSAAAATATPTPTSTQTSIPAATPSQIATTFTPTSTTAATALPSNIKVKIGSVAIDEGQSQVQVPLDLQSADDAHPVGVVSLAVQYDAAKLKAITCNVGSSFDLLLCNLAQPGIIQLAGVDADGIRSNVRIADIGFEILQPAKLSTPLTVQLKRVSNRDGDALETVAQNGQVSLSCTAGSANCHNVYLPLVQR